MHSSRGRSRTHTGLRSYPMRKALLTLVVSAVVPALIVTACKKKQEDQPPQQGGYGQPNYNGGYGNAPATGTPPPATSPAAGGMSTPAPMAFPCQSDAQCLTHRCNTQY